MAFHAAEPEADDFFLSLGEQRRKNELYMRYSD